MGRRRTSRRRTTRNARRRTTRSKELQKLIKSARKQGWMVEKTRGGHIRFVPPDKDKPIVVSGSTPSDRRSVLNLRAQLRRTGLKVNTPRGKASAGVTIVARPTRRLLLLRRSPLVRNPGLWSIPAGRVEPDEDVLAGALRELREETGFRGPLEIVEHLPDRRFHNFIAVCSNEFRPRLNWENDAAGWFAKGYHPQPLHPGMRRVLAGL